MPWELMDECNSTPGVGGTRGTGARKMEVKPGDGVGPWRDYVVKSALSGRPNIRWRCAGSRGEVVLRLPGFSQRTRSALANMC